MYKSHLSEKEIYWVGSSYDDLIQFPASARQCAGFQLSKVQANLDPDNWKPFEEIGPGTKEIRIRDTQGIFRIMYVAKFVDAIYVLHCFQKKTERTSKQDKLIAATRYRAIAQGRKASR
ncbi:MAG: type II toxin-antitoxin system RelE/ParE family toxin [Alcaligenaceae bacterium]|nr:MAG: type II toxin-antitoxin system RelE/ParE family toxin [Alcaligenaceae bacterium]